MGFLDTIADAIWTRLKPEVDEMQAMTKTELDEWQVIIQQQLDALRTETLTMLRDALPDMAGEIAKQAVLTTFKHTNVDEATDAVSNVITEIVGRLPFGLGR